MMKDYINSFIYYYLFSVTKFKIIYNKMIRYITDTNEITSFDKNTGNIRNIIWRYYLIRIIDYLVLFLKNTRKKLDVKVDKIQIIKNYEEGQRTIILDSDMYENNNKITITDLLKHINNKKISDKPQSCFMVFVKFELHDPPKKPICLKKYLVKYKDTNQFHHHTLKNIVSFNNLKVDSSKAFLNISFFKNSQIKNLKIPFHNIHNVHINDFHEPEKLLEE